MIVLGLALSNGLVALSGALLAQYQGFADVQMGIGMVVWGLASVIIGEALVGSRQLGLRHRRRRDGLGAVPFAGGHRAALGPEPERPEAGHRAFVFVALVLPPALQRFGIGAAETVEVQDRMLS